ncbi:Vacuolar protein sorting-associated protein 17 [Malassezia vespertilionis]|nr:Vacuolar protein sorting-associated protein 17 [Malassezia vespertilionis]WFD04941.1 Vacuolar protein sorting-associated protein 17 [Malassezia vespertilionis]
MAKDAHSLQAESTPPPAPPKDVAGPRRACYDKTDYPQIDRSYKELAMYATAVALIGPAIIVPALPLPTPSMLKLPDAEQGTYELHELRTLLVRWFGRMLSEPSLCMHRETRRFIEADYTYEPEICTRKEPRETYRHFMRSSTQIDTLAHVFSGELFVPQAGVASLFGMRTQPKPTPAALFSTQLAAATSLGSADPDEQLALTRTEVTKLEKQLADVASASADVTAARAEVYAAMQDVAGTLIPLATLEDGRGESIRGMLPRTLRGAQTLFSNIAELSEAIQHAEEVSLTGAIEYQQYNMRAARAVLQERAAVVAEHGIAKRVTSNKRQEAEGLRIARTAKPDRVESAMDEVREAEHQEQLLERYLQHVGKSLRESLQRHSVHTHCDLQHTILEHARSSIAYERRVADMIGLSAKDLSAVAQDAQRAAMARANVKRKMTPAQIAAIRAVEGDKEGDKEGSREGDKEGMESKHGDEQGNAQRDEQRGEQGNEQRGEQGDKQRNEQGSTTQSPHEDAKENAENTADSGAEVAAENTDSDTSASLWKDDALQSALQDEIHTSPWDNDSRATDTTTERTSAWHTNPPEESPWCSLPLSSSSPPHTPTCPDSPPQRSPPPAPIQSSLFRPRALNGTFGGLSAADAARSLAGTF